MDRIYLVGATQETRTIASMLLDKDPVAEIDLLVERGFGVLGSKFHGLQVIAYVDALEEMPVRGSIVFADPNPVHRSEVVKILDKAKSGGRYWRIKSVVAPSAVVSSSAKIGKGCIIFPGAVVMDGVVIEDYAMVMANATLNNESHIGVFSTVYAGVTLGTKSYVGMGGICGLGSTIVAGKRVGAWSQVQDGYCLKTDLKPGSNTSTPSSGKR